MKITILPFEKNTAPLDRIMLYNLIKRSQEDLLAAHPELDEFILEIKIHPTFIKYNSLPHSRYAFDATNSVVTLMIASYPQQVPERVYELVSEKLIHIKTT